MEKNCILEIEQTLKGYYNLYITIGECKRVEIMVRNPSRKFLFKLSKQIENGK